MSSTTLWLSSSTPAQTPEVGIDSDGTDSQANVETQFSRHPLGLRPAGNALTSTQNASQQMGLFGLLPDSLLLTLFEFLDQSALTNLGSTCRGLYAYCSFDPLWRDIAVNNMQDTFEWRGSWRASLRRLPTRKLADVDCRYVFSDSLHRPYLCSQIPFTPYVLDIPLQNQITRLGDLSAEEFNQSWVDKPFILTEPVKKWRAYQMWDEQNLLAKYGDVIFICEGIKWPLKQYLRYMGSTQDESPIYLFDRGFVEKMGLQMNSKDSTMPNAYVPPAAFLEDFFTLLREQRPDHRWLIIGPARSGSTFHKDPNATSAWNGVLSGSKYWIMFPNSILPPGVYMSEDQSEVTSPLSIAEWLLSFHAEARMTPGCIEGICRSGEVLHVPSGWWHLVVNLEPAVAITQNFVPKAHLRSAIRFLRTKPDQISGFSDSVKDAYNLFMDRLRVAHPDLAATGDECNGKKRKWEDVVADKENADGDQQSFSFDFLGDIEDEEDI